MVFFCVTLIDPQCGSMLHLKHLGEKYNWERLMGIFGDGGTTQVIMVNLHGYLLGESCGQRGVFIKPKNPSINGEFRTLGLASHVS